MFFRRSEGRPPNPNALARNRDYLYITTGESLSTLGGAIASFALPLVILQLTGSALQASLVATGGVLGNLLAALLAGGWVDGHSRRAAMSASLAARVLVWCAVAVMVGLSWTYLPVYIVLAAIGGIAAAFYRAAEAGALRVIVPEDQYPQAMSVIEGRQATASVAGGPIGGALLAAGNSVPFWVNAGSFLLSLLGVTRTRAELGRPAVEPGYRVLSAVKDGLRYIWTRRVFRRLTLAASLANFSVAAFNFTLIVMLQRRGEPYWVIGLVQTMIGVSLLVGSVFAPRLTRSFSVGALVVGSALLETAMFCVAVLLNAFIVPLLIVTSVCYLLAPASNAAWLSYLALATPHEYQGRLASAEDFFSTALLPLGTVAAGLLIAGSSTTPALVVLAACYALSTAYLVSSAAIRRLPRLGSAEAA